MIEQHPPVQQHLAVNGSAAEIRETLNDLNYFDRVPSLAVLKPEPISWLIKPFIPMESLVLFAGRPGSFKSLMALDIARAVASGRPFGGMQSPNPRRVLYVDRENGRNSMAHRAQLMGLHRFDIAELRYWGRWVPLEFPAVNSDVLLQYAEHFRPLIIFDSLIRFHAGDENDNAKMAKIMNQFVSLARAGATVLVLHHQGKTKEKDYRGAEEIEAAVDIAYKIERPQPGAKSVFCKQFKNRMDEEQTFAFRFENGLFETSVDDLE